MDWHRHGGRAGDPGGIGDLLRRFQVEVGGPPLRGTRFLHDAREMLRSTRMIERTVAGHDTTLYVGFQTAGKLDAERDRYARLGEGPTRILAFGLSRPKAGIGGVTWHELTDDPLALENQWYLVTTAPEPVAFVGYETSPARLRAAGGAAGTGKTWEGFVTDDPRLVGGIVAHLERVARDAGPVGRPDGGAGGGATAAPLYLVVTDDGTGGNQRVLAAGLDLARRDGARVLLYDRSSESYFTDPYDIGPWSSDAHGIGPGSALEPEALEALGRRYLADQLRAARARGLEASAFLGIGTGARALADAHDRFAPDLLVLPAGMAEPRLIDRLRRDTLDDLRRLRDVRVRLVDAAGALVGTPAG